MKLKECILIVEDNPINLKLTKLLLSLDGYEVHSAINAQETLDLLINHHPKLILMDLQLPGKNGFTLIREIRMVPAHNDIFIVALTAYAMKGDDLKVKSYGFNGYMTKPISVNSFSAQITRYLLMQTTLPQKENYL